MSPEFTYFMKVNVAFVLFYAFYRLFFYKDTFFKLRRTILLSFFGLALLYPLFNLQEWMMGQEPINSVIYMYSAVMLPDVTVNGSQTVGWSNLLKTGALVLYGIGMLLFAVRFLVQLTCILRLAYTSGQAVIGGIKVRILKHGGGPFSFFHLIFISPENLSEKETEEILTHEWTHVSQWHSIDVIASEIIAILCWFNPFVWLLRREVRHNLEYLADNKVIQAGYDSKSYQYHLLGLAHHSGVSSDLYNSFNVIHLKNRIFMMNKKRSHGIGRAKYLAFLPLVGLLMLLSNIEAVARVTGKLAGEDNTPQRSDTLKVKESGPGDEVFIMVENMPRFPGGDGALLKFLAANIKYPQEARDKKIKGRVITRFIVDKDGSITDVDIVQGVDPLLDAEAIRVVNTFPKWTPGTQKGEPVRVMYTVPITFRLD